jgi:hypothetical protein
MERKTKRQENSAPEKAKFEAELSDAALQNVSGGAVSAGNWSIFFGDVTIKPPTTPYEKAKFGVGTCSK